MHCTPSDPNTESPSEGPACRRSKRAADLVLAGLLALAALPLILISALLVRLSSPGPVVYRAQRLGANLQPFCIRKFRTMVENGDEVLERHLVEHPGKRLEWQSRFKLRHDPRVTRIGRFLRMTSLDELPQLWNVLRGDMSLVGPRPIIDAERSLYGSDRAEWVFSRAKPGITGLWQVSGRSRASYRERVELDVEYVRRWRLLLDIKILVRTVGTVLLCRGAY